MMAFFLRRGQFFWAVVVTVFILLILTIDILTGYEISISLFYLIPVGIATWFSGRRSGIVASVISALGWFIADYFTNHTYSNPIFPVWNAVIRFGFFIVVTYLLDALKKAYHRERVMARTDSLTGAVNPGFFTDLLQREMDRSLRVGGPCTLAYFDIDDFKGLNDHYGHPMGDRILVTVVGLARDSLRKTDIIARLGGDEFAILLPDTDQVSARKALNRLHGNLMDGMKKNDWLVTFSMGVVTWTGKTSPGAEEFIKQADDLMYSVKNKNKNSIRYSTLSI
jgi:diguanylate cyclase (GGDEF)-like protein